jgi:tetratricopeptide (TPR) repeat protein
MTYSGKLAAGVVLSVSLLMLPAILPGDAPGALASVSHAQAAEPRKERKTRKTPAMREKTYKKLSESRELAEADDFAGALRALDNLSRQRGLNSYELAQMHNFYGFIHFSQENYAQAVRDYENVLAQPNLPLGMETSTIYTLAQLYFTQEDYLGAENQLRKWFTVADNPGPEPYILLGQALYQQNKFREAIVPVERAISIRVNQGKPPKENWLLLLRVFYFELGDLAKVEEILKQLLVLNPKKDYWVQLSGIYGERDEINKQLTAFEIVYVQGLLKTSREHVTMAQLYLQSDVPYKAGKVLESGFKAGAIEKTARNYRLMAQSWTMAQEDAKAIPALVQAAKLSDDGELDVRLANAYFNLGQWRESISSSRAGIKKGGLKRNDQANILLGMALYNVERYSQAIEAFRVARRDDRSSRMASQWINHVTNERARQEQLRQALAN